MPSIPQLRDRLQKTLGRKRDKPVWFHAFTGRADGVVEVPGLDGYIYVTDWPGIVHIALNEIAPTNPAGLPVRVGYGDYDSLVLRVLGILNPWPQSTWSKLRSHHTTHEWPHADTVWVQGPQIVAGGLVSRKIANTVRVYPIRLAMNDGSIKFIQRQDIDLDSHVPATGAVWVVISFSRVDGTLLVEDLGAQPTGNKSALMLTDIPAATENYTRIAAVAMSAGQAAIVQNANQNDIVDLRWGPSQSGAGGGGAGSFTDLDDVPNSYVGEEFKIVRVNGAATGLEFVAASNSIAMVKEDWTDQVDGVETNFVTAYAFIPDTLVVIDSGVSEMLSVTEDSLTHDNFDLDYAPQVGHKLFGFYFRVLPGTGIVTSVNGDTGDVLVQRQVVFSYEGELSIVPTTGQIKVPNLTSDTLNIEKVQLHVGVPPETDPIIVDIDKDGTTIFTDQAHRPQIAAGASSGYTTMIDVSAWAPGEVLTMDVDASGLSPDYGSHLTVTVLCNG